MITYIKSPITLILTTQTHSFLILNVIIMDIKLWDLIQFVDFWSSAHPTILFCPSSQHLNTFSFLHFPLWIIYSVNHWNSEECVLSFSPQHVGRKPYSRQSVKNIVRNPEHPLRCPSFWVHKVRLRASVNEPLCDPSCSHISQMETVRQKTGNISRKDTSVLSETRLGYVFPEYSQETGSAFGVTWDL